MGIWGLASILGGFVFSRFNLRASGGLGKLIERLQIWRICGKLYLFHDTEIAIGVRAREGRV